MTIWREKRIILGLMRLNRLVSATTTPTGTTVTIWTGRDLLHGGLEQAAIWERQYRRLEKERRR